MEKNTEKKKNNWIVWLIVAIIVILIIVFAVRSCNCKRTGCEVVMTEAVVAVPENTKTEMMVFVEHTLPDGEMIKVAEGGCEDCMMKYLKSDAYKNATNAELQKNWIQFDNIDFQHDSATELEGNSMEQVHNIVKILKNYPDVKIKIGGLADKTGGKIANMEISKERANFVKSLLVADGINAKRISTEGFGEELAAVPADATNAQRAVDRSIAMRFTK